ncbi:MAG: hypothetical protein EAZ89_14920 [Bacteroidetes bacterium]|nr:MAG: hypothetical protein EAZ89_14920 [Bacteroidota bacterium]
MAEARLQAAKNQVRIGEALDVTLLSQYESGLRFLGVYLPDTLGAWELLGRSQADSTQTANLILKKQKLTVICFDTGMQRIPPVRIEYLQTNGDTLTVFTSGLGIQVFPVPTDPGQPLRDIKEIIAEPATLADYLPWILLAVGIIGAALGLFLYFRKKKPKPEVPARPAAPPLAPHIYALDQLTRIEQERPWRVDVKAYYVSLTDILRGYLDQQFQLPAHEMVTDEILEGVRKVSPDPELGKLLKDALFLADMAKFARQEPQESENVAALEAIRQFITRSAALGNATSETPTNPTGNA